MFDKAPEDGPAQSRGKCEIGHQRGSPWNTASFRRSAAHSSSAEETGEKRWNRNSKVLLECT